MTRPAPAASQFGQQPGRPLSRPVCTGDSPNARAYPHTIYWKPLPEAYRCELIVRSAICAGLAGQPSSRAIPRMCRPIVQQLGQCG
jgi:hypothetical protein